jgi:propanol-preferring alcohol dehydrogenase
VAVASPASCGRCRWCRAGRENRCSAGLAGRGYGRDGGLAGFVVVDDPRALLPLEGLDPAVAGPLTDAAATSHHAVRRVLDRLVADDPVGVADATVAVIGVGGLGAFAVQLLKALSDVRVVAVDPDPVRQAVAAAHGADVVLDGVGERGAQLREAAGRAGLDGCIDLVGTDETIAASVAALGAGGSLAVVGAAGGTLRRPWYGTLPRDGEAFTFQGSDLADARAVLALAAAGRLAVDVVPFPLDRAAEAFDAVAAGSLAGRAVVRP